MCLHGVPKRISVQAEVERLIFEDSDPETGFVVHPDMKWVITPVSSAH